MFPMPMSTAEPARIRVLLFARYAELLGTTDLDLPASSAGLVRDIVYRELFGKPPSGIKFEALKAANMSSTNMTRMFLMPPKSPPETIATLRKAFDGLAKDQDFLQDAVATMRFQPRFEVGEIGELLAEDLPQRLPGAHRRCISL